MKQARENPMLPEGREEGEKPHALEDGRGEESQAA
jgi:hypothetical protein